MQTDFHKKYQDKIGGTISCYDRVIIHGSLSKWSDQKGIVYIFSSMEICDCYDPTFDRINNKAYLKYGTSKCLHYYIYFVDRMFGLCYLYKIYFLPRYNVFAENIWRLGKSFPN
ncbi:MAG: hypothetical protein ACYCVH_02450 [Ignavibacteriaceae bacterium]